MQCPRCAFRASSKVTRCPRCGASMVKTPLRKHASSSVSLEDPDENRCCPTCGALVSADARTCPHCSMPLPAPRHSSERANEPKADLSERPTRFLPRLASAIPDPRASKEELTHDRRTTSALVIAAVCAALVFCAALLAFTHPWDPNLFDTRAQVPADTSMEGFPGTIDKLQSQDSDGSAEGGQTESLTFDETIYRELAEDLAALDAMDEALDAQYAKLAADSVASDETRAADAKEARLFAIDLSNLIASIQELDTSSGTYLEEQSKMVQMGNYLRNRSDSILEAWDEALASSDPQADKLRILASAKEESERYGGLFDDARRSFALRAPAEKAGS